MKDTHLTDRQRKFVELYAGGKMDKVHAALAAGYQGAGAKKAGSRLLNNPSVRQAIDAIRQKGREMAAYGLVEAMKEAEDAAIFARKNGNSMANVKAAELRAKLSGLLIDRVEVVTVDLRGALEAAERRVINVTPLFSDGVLAGSVRWAPNIPGAPVAENPEAGPVDGESVRQVNNVGPENR